MEVSIQQASENDIPLIRDIANESWNAHYPAIIGQAQVDYMLNLMYSPQSLRDQMQNGHIFYRVNSGSRMIGFISVAWTHPGELYLHKFYVLSTEQDKGVGKKTWDAILHELSPATVTLNVNRMNYKSVNFYFKLGFKITRVVNFDIGEGFVMEDFEMKNTIHPKN